MSYLMTSWSWHSVIASSYDCMMLLCPLRHISDHPLCPHLRCPESHVMSSKCQCQLPPPASCHHHSQIHFNHLLEGHSMTFRIFSFYKGFRIIRHVMEVRGDDPMLMLSWSWLWPKIFILTKTLLEEVSLASELVRKWLGKSKYLLQIWKWAQSFSFDKKKSTEIYFMMW